MKPSEYIKHMPLKVRLVVLMAAPILALVLGISVHHYVSELGEIERSLVEENHGLVEVLKRDFEKGILLGDQTAGVGVVDRLRSLPKVRYLETFGSDGTPIFVYR